MTHPVIAPKKLIEVALPLDAINVAAAREKSIRHGHPSTLHLWWARRPLAAARAVIFAQLVNDPSWKWDLEHPGEIPPGHLKASWAASRKRLFRILEELVLWENTTNEKVLEKARAEIRKSWRETCDANRDHPDAAELFNPAKLPGLHDPFAGGGAIPLEAQRLGLEAYASDLNPVAVLINKAMIEIPPKFAGRPPVNPESREKEIGGKEIGEKEIGNRAEGNRGEKGRSASAPTSYLLFPTSYSGAQGLADDVRYYGQWMRDEAEKRIGHLYPKVKVTPEMVRARPDLKPYQDQELTVIAWLWARTVKSPNPAFRHVDVPLASTFVLSSKAGKQAYVEPVIQGDGYRFTVKVGTPPADAKNGTKSGGSRSDFLCLMSQSPMDFGYLRDEAKQGRMGQRLMAIVAEGDRGRVYLSPTEDMEAVAKSAAPAWKPETPLPERALGFRVQEYGMLKWADLFTDRQLVALTTFSDLVGEARARVLADACAAGLPDDGLPLADGGTGALAYADAVSVYLAFGVDKMSDRHSTLGRWDPTPTASGIINTFSRQALPMTWDFAEANPFSEASANFASGVGWIAKVIDMALSGTANAFATAAEASTQIISAAKFVSTDPPYYDNIGYADLSDYFYVWLRRSLRRVLPKHFSTMAVPKSEELVATPYRHGSKIEAEAFFLEGMTRAIARLAQQAHPSAPVTIYYAFKQSETNSDSGTSSTGWDTFLEAVLRAGFSLTGTWPMRTELGNRMIGSGTNALASSVVLVCRPRPADAPTISRRAFLRRLNAVLPEALDAMTRGDGDGGPSPVAPVDLSQAIIGPGMALFSQYAAVLEADGAPMSVRTALTLINRFLAEDDFDADTQFCLHWFEQYGWRPGRFGEADTLARAKGTSVDGVRQSGVLSASGGVVQLLRWSDYPAAWDPRADDRLPVWEVLHHLVRALELGGDAAAGAILAAVAAKSEPTRQLAYRLYTLCERAGWAEDARGYNNLVTSWSAIERAAAQSLAPQQRATLFDVEE